MFSRLCVLELVVPVICSSMLDALLIAVCRICILSSSILPVSIDCLLQDFVQMQPGFLVHWQFFIICLDSWYALLEMILEICYFTTTFCLGFHF